MVADTRGSQGGAEISVVLPVYNERGNLGGLLDELAAAIAPVTTSYEILCVDDASTDGSDEELRAQAASRAYVKPLFHVRNCGQSAALASGIGRAAGRIVVTLDADGQNDPADLPVLLAKLTDGVDAVCGVRQKRQDTFVRRVSSRVANRARNWITGDRVQDAGCNFRVMRREALRELPVFNGWHRFLPTLLRFQGYTVVEQPISHRPRQWGTSKYGIHNRLWRGILDSLAMRWWRRRACPGRRLRDA